MASFAIEAPGEANPLNDRSLLHSLQAASSGIPTQIQSGTKQLSEWERADGFYRHLYTVFAERSLPHEVRYLAIIQLKNGIDKYWRKTATNAISKDDKASIKSRLVECGVNEENVQLALHNALVVAKVIRFEYPQDWPDAIGKVLDAVRDTSSHVTDWRLERALLLMLNVVKELSTARMQRSRTALQKVTPELLAALGALYVDRFQRWQRAQTTASGMDVEMLARQSLLCIRILRRLVVAGYDFPNREEDVCGFWKITQTQVDTLIRDGVRSEQLPNTARMLGRKILVQISKFHLEMSNKHPAAFTLLPASLDLVRAYWGLVKEFSASYASQSGINSNTQFDGKDAEGTGKTSERLALNGLLLIRACIRMAFMPVHTFRYRKDDEKEEKRQAETLIKSDLLTQPFVEDTMGTIITSFLVLRQNDLKDWTEEPEEWVVNEENESEDMLLSVRACSERLILDISNHFKDTMRAPMLNLFHSVTAIGPEDILRKDAIYAAIGLAAPLIRDDIDFGVLAKMTLANEVQQTYQGVSILRRRIAIVCGQWAITKINSETRISIFQIFDFILKKTDPLNDLVVRITAGVHFKQIADDFEFEPEGFKPFAESIIGSLMALIEEVEHAGSKIALLDTISTLIERFEQGITPFADRIIGVLPALWEESGEEHLTKQSILTILGRLTNATKQLSTNLHGILLPLIRSTCDPSSGLAPYVMEESLDLWHFVLIQAPAINPDLRDLLQLTFACLSSGPDSLRQTLEIIESYVLLDPETMLSEPIRRPLLDAISPMIAPDTRPEANGLVCTIIELMLSNASTLGGESGVKQFAADMVEASLLPRILTGLRSSWTAHCTTGPLAKVPAVDGIIETDYFAILARLALASIDTFVQAMTYTPMTVLDGDRVLPPEPLPSEGTMKWLLEEWFSHLENVGDPSRRKLFLLALTRLLEVGQEEALKNLQLLMSLWTDTMTEICEVDWDPVREEGTGRVTGEGDTLIYDEKDVGAFDLQYMTAEDHRRRSTSLRDPVHRIPVVQAVRAGLAAAVRGAGGEESFRDRWLVDVDKEVVAAFGRLGIM